jgi:sugar lactone lactonase YvrE
VAPGTQNIYELSPSGFVKVAATGLTAVLGLAFDAHGRLYTLETATTAGPYPDPSTAGTGKVVRVNGVGTLTTIASGLYYPTAMTFDADGNELYVSNHGFGQAILFGRVAGS